MEYGSNFGLPGFERTLTDGEVIDEINQFEQALIDLGDHPPGNSEALIAFSQAALSDLHNTEFPEFSAVVAGFIRDRPEMVAPYKVQLFWRTFQYTLINRQADVQYPQAYKQPRAWHAAFRDILVDPPDRMNYEGWTLRELLATNNNQTNEPRRYAGVKLAIAAHAQKLPESLSIVDAGCSVGLGQIQIGENIPFTGIAIEADKDTRKLLREKLLARLSITNNVGFDQVIGIDPKWVEANSFYPSELEENKYNNSKKHFRDFLYRRRADFIREHADLTEGQICTKDVLARNNGQAYDVAMALTSLYEIPKDKLGGAVDTLQSLTNKLVVVQDFANINPADPTKLEFAVDLYAPETKYRMFTKLVGEEDQWTHLGTWNSGRCTRFRPTAALIEKCLEANF